MAVSLPHCELLHEVNSSVHILFAVLSCFSVSHFRPFTVNITSYNISRQNPKMGKSVQLLSCACSKKNLNASRSSSEHPPVKGNKMSKRLGEIIVGSAKDKTSSWHLIGFPDGSNIGS